MKIKTQFIITMILFGLLLIGMTASLIVTNRLADRLYAQEELAHNIERAARELSYLSNDYLLHRESQQRARWEAKFSALSEDLDQLHPNSPEGRVLAGQIQTNQKHLKSVFDEVAATLEGGSETWDVDTEITFMQVSWSRMEVQNQSTIFDAAQLAQEIQDQIYQLKQINILLIFILTGIFGIYILVNYFLIYRRTLRALANLQAGTEIIGTGNLAFRFDDQRPDEIGELAHAFNRMATNLKEVTASRADLEREIEERVRAEDRMRNYAEKLEKSNRELQEFAYVASHDLQEPLRKIDAFGNLLLNTGGNLDERQRNFLERMRSASRRMQQMVDGLLLLSRVTTQAKPLAPVELSQVVTEVLSDLEIQIQRTRGKVELSELPVVEADSLQMRQLLQNLIGNALKYHPPGVPPVVKVYSPGTSDQRPGTENESQVPVHQSQVPDHQSQVPDHQSLVTILIEDNGIGFDESCVERIFQPFQRLVGRSEYEGSGMGLAICRKIIERHGGNITAKSTPGIGSTFIVALPCKARTP